LHAPAQLAIIAGNGIYPLELARAARTAGVQKIFAIAFEDETSAILAELVDEICWLRVGQLSRMLASLRDSKIRNAIMAGQIAPRNLFDLHPDWRALLLLAKLKRRNAESIFRAIADELEKIGVTLLPATTFLEDFLVTKDLIAGPKLSRREKSDVDFGWEIAQKIAALDIGQTVIVKNGTVLAVEGLEGTNETIHRGGKLAGSGAVVIKVAKPDQDMRFDVPIVGPETISVAAEAKIRVIALEAGRTLILTKEMVLGTAEKARIALFGR
jgi:UDP-2,3-diacylglucosamine hydrolase